VKTHTDPVTEPTAGIDIDGASTEQVYDWLNRMLLIREFESTAAPLALNGTIPGGMHSAAGQEAVAVGVLAALGPGDVTAASHRSHHVAIASGIDPRAAMAELFGKASGVARGRGGHMHLADFDAGFFGSNGIVGASAGIALGAALAQSYRGEPQVSAAFFGDGAANTGRTWEFANLAATWRLPLIFVCENNGYAVETRIADSMAGESIAGRASGFGMPAVQVDGQDVAALWRTARKAAERARAGDGPTFIEALTYRHLGHDVGERGKYRTADEVEWWLSYRDPIARLRAAAIARGDLDDASYDAAVDRARQRVADAVAYATDADRPDPSTVTDDVTATPLHVRTNR
jgi:acetoin:2,6-dichlorophenolindophenol oxidoreductase subunit alpha